MYKCLAWYLQELGELQVAEAFVSVIAEMQADELAVPVEGDVVVHGRLAEDITHILCKHTDMDRFTLPQSILDVTALLTVLYSFAIFTSYIIIYMCVNE